MNTTILNYKKTKHFMYRQWDRNITDHLLYRVLPLLNETQPNIKVLFWVDLHKLKVPPPSRYSKLGLVIKNQVLISCFWRETNGDSVSFAITAKSRQ